MDRMQEMLANMGNSKFDAAAYAASRTMEQQNKMSSRKFMGAAVDSAEISSFWKNRGLNREFHGNIDDRTTHWISYTPISEPGSDEKFPLLFVLHGANNPVALAETYGYVELAEKHRLILIIPENERTDNILSLLKYAEGTWPVDKSRVYCVGYSFGAMNAGHIGLEYPHIFAAIGMGGMVHASSTGEMEMTDVIYPPFELTDKMVDRAAGLVLPSCTFVGEHEVLNFVPLYEDSVDKEKDPGKLVEPFPYAKLAAYNVWRRAGGCSPIPLDELLEKSPISADIVVNKIGALFDRTEVRTYDDRTHYIGDALTGDGICTTRYICAAKAPHWPTNRMAELIWEHIGKFARDRETGQLS